MIIFNSTFMIETERESEFLKWFAANMHMLGNHSNSRLSAMREAGGTDWRHAEAHSIAWQTEFSSIRDAKKWSDEIFRPLAAEFEKHFAPNAIVFTSLFETIELN
ncbi:MAG: DUF4286 family protein [Candidatus Amulumruptor caecigallinarius]|nr:DUF4286 family protein [Candidatus Amulumruptor caecigallinarius]